MKDAVAVLLALILVNGCIERVDRRPDGFNKQRAIQASEQIIDDFQRALKEQLVSAMTEGGPESAIGVCHTVAPMIADSFSSMPGIDIRRVSLRRRNQQFKPDSFETEVLAKFATAGSLEPLAYSELVLDSGRVRHFRYMKEIKVGQLCLKCHGDPNQFSNSLKKALAEDYPGDRAVGYSVGDSRGGFSVYMRFPEAEATITEILTVNGR